MGANHRTWAATGARGRRRISSPPGAPCPAAVGDRVVWPVTGIDGYGRIPVYRLRGTAHERGMAHGSGARELIGQAIEIYRDWFDWYAGVQWGEALAGAATSWGMIRRYAPAIADEIRGMAEGSGRDLMEIVALNARTEIAYGLGFARQLAKARQGTTQEEGCTSFAILPEHTGGLGVICGQNWDWQQACMPIRVALDIELVDGLRVLTFCEAGQVGKIGMNSAGLVV